MKKILKILTAIMLGILLIVSVLSENYWFSAFIASIFVMYFWYKSTYSYKIPDDYVAKREKEMWERGHRW